MGLRLLAFYTCFVRLSSSHGVMNLAVCGRECTDVLTFLFDKDFHHRHLHFYSNCYEARGYQKFEKGAAFKGTTSGISTTHVKEVRLYLFLRWNCHSAEASQILRKDSVPCPWSITVVCPLRIVPNDPGLHCVHRSSYVSDFSWTLSPVMPTTFCRGVWLISPKAINLYSSYQRSSY